MAIIVYLLVSLGAAVLVWSGYYTFSDVSWRGPGSIILWVAALSIIPLEVYVWDQVSKFNRWVMPDDVGQGTRRIAVPVMIATFCLAAILGNHTFRTEAIAYMLAFKFVYAPILAGLWLMGLVRLCQVQIDKRYARTYYAQFVDPGRRSRGIGGSETRS